MQAVVLAAGKGTRMLSERPKVLHEIFDKPLLGHVIGTLEKLGILRPKVIVGYGADQVRSYLEKSKSYPAQSSDIILQRNQRGTGHAVMMAESRLARFSGDILIWPGDMPLLKEETLRVFIREHQASGAQVSVLSSLAVEPKGYGRILRAGGKFYAIREELDASEAEKRIQEVNTGVYLFNAKSLFGALKKIKPNNRKKELYLTDVIEVLSGEEKKIEAFPFASLEEGQGINSRVDLAGAVKIMKNRETVKHMEAGVTIISPEQTFIAPDVKIGRDTVIYPWCYIESGVKVGQNCQIGPFAKIRKGSEIGDDSIVGSFVEINRSRLGRKVYAKHLSYLGDAQIGDGSNVGAGAITANYDGKNKHKTQIGKNVLVGSNTVFVAPVNVENGARTGAGSVVTAGTRVKKGEVVAGVPARALRTNKKRK